MLFKNLFTMSFLAGGLALAAPGMIFNCADDFQDVCDNMCWGAFCTQPTFGSVLNFDMFGGTGNENSNLTLARHKSAGCYPEFNRCSKANLQCNEYPFASTSDADKGGQVSRCVTSKNMDRQRAIMMRYYVTACKEAPCEFIVGFGNPGAPGLKYCQAYNDPHGQCINDEANPIYKNGAPDVRPPVQKRSEPESVVHYGLFLMGVTQMKVLLPIDTPLNAKFVHPPARKNNDNAQGDSDAVIEIDIEIEWEFVEDFVAARLD